MKGINTEIRIRGKGKTSAQVFRLADDCVHAFGDKKALVQGIVTMIESLIDTQQTFGGTALSSVFTHIYNHLPTEKREEFRQMLEAMAESMSGTLPEGVDGKYKDMRELITEAGADDSDLVKWAAQTRGIFTGKKSVRKMVVSMIPSFSDKIYFLNLKDIKAEQRAAYKASSTKPAKDTTKATKTAQSAAKKKTVAKKKVAKKRAKTSKTTNT